MKVKNISMTTEEYLKLPPGTTFKEPTRINFEDGTNITVWKPLPLLKGGRIYYKNTVNPKLIIEDYGTIDTPHHTKEEPMHCHNRKWYVCDGIVATLDNGLRVEVYFDETQLSGNRVDIGKVQVEFLGI